MNREGFARKASWRTFPVLGCKGGWGREGGGTHSGEVPQGPLGLTKVPFPSTLPHPRVTGLRRSGLSRASKSTWE